MQQRSSKLNSTCGGLLLQLRIRVTRRLEDKTSTGLKRGLTPLDEALASFVYCNKVRLPMDTLLQSTAVLDFCRCSYVSPRSQCSPTHIICFFWHPTELLDSCLHVSAIGTAPKQLHHEKIGELVPRVGAGGSREAIRSTWSHSSCEF